MKAFIVIFYVVLKNADAAGPSEFNYEDQDAWQGECTTGIEQSPINLESAKARIGGPIKGPLVFTGYENVSVVAVNNGHTLEWSPAPGQQAPMLSGGPLQCDYIFQQFHLHWISEHAVDGLKYDLEIHFVHIKAGLTMEQALMRPDGFAVVATLCEVFASVDRQTAIRYEYALDEIMEQVPEIINNTGQRVGPNRIDMRRLLSPNIQKYYTYHGSLTTPPCTEAVTWIVMDTPIMIADTQLKEIHEADIGGDHDNFRELQPSNRQVYRSSGSAYHLNLSVLFAMSLSLLLTTILRHY